MGRKFSSEDFEEKDRCPMIFDPRDKCYCACTSSENVKNVLYFCNERFWECAIFKEILIEKIVSSKGQTGLENKP